MPKSPKKIWKKLGTTILVLVVLILVSGYLLNIWLRIPPPVVSDYSVTEKNILQKPTGEIVFDSCMFRKSESGLWEMYLAGSPFHRGVAAGKMTDSLLKYQEDVFIRQIRRIIPSDTYLMMLRNFIGFFNRNLPENIPEELKEEIYGISLSCTHEYDFIGTPYERQLNYHAAHDLGHAMQDYMLVSCTSFAGWNESTEDSLLLIGRNFDFYAGDDFSKNKIVAFYQPDRGYRFVSVTWAGMTGVLSGMNEKGLTITINAAKSQMPHSSSTPISILCREILQYASNIEEAYAIASQKNTFVSESILIGSASDNCAVIIEKSPHQIALYKSDKSWLVCANHYQSETFKNDPENIKNISESDSPYRQERTEELIREKLPLNPVRASEILRDKKGLGNKDIGMGNEKAINQLICHHSVIFSPQKKIIWISTSPWQLGEYVAYDLNKVFSGPDFSSEIKTDSLSIPEDPFLLSSDYQNFIWYRSCSRDIESAIRDEKIIPEESINHFLTGNPEYYFTYELVGDYYASQKNSEKAIEFWEKSLKKEIPKLKIAENIRNKIISHR